MITLLEVGAVVCFDDPKNSISGVDREVIQGIIFYTNIFPISLNAIAMHEIEGKKDMQMIYKPRKVLHEMLLI